MKPFKIKRTPGFRINLTDTLFIGLLLAMSALLYLYLPSSSIYGLPLYLGGSFFLFCNIFRIGNRLEPYWYLPFVLFAAYCLHDGLNMAFFWDGVLYGLEPLKWGLIAFHIWRGPYRGLGHRWINSRQEQLGEKDRAE